MAKHQDEGPSQSRRSEGGLFDLRRLLAFVLGGYGVLLVATGLSDTKQSLVKADDVPINLIVGAVLLIAAIAFAAWERLDRAD